MKRLVLSMLVAVLAAGAAAAQEPGGAKTSKPKPSFPPGCVEVQHILVSFDGAPRIKPPGRTKEEAAKLAAEVLGRARKGEDFLKLVEKYTSDSAPGVYRMCDQNPAPPTFVPRGNMVKAFGDVSFSLKPGEIGTTTYDPQTSPYGWHIIKRLR